MVGIDVKDLRRVDYNGFRESSSKIDGVYEILLQPEKIIIIKCLVLLDRYRRRDGYRIKKEHAKCHRQFQRKSNEEKKT